MLELLQKLEQKAQKCQACGLADTRLNVVFGGGSSEARIMLIGEAPGKEEDKSGAPFVGDAGDMLDTLLSRAGIDRRTIYIANTVKCRPVDPLGNNRPPTKQEVQSCKPLLLEQIYLVDPVVIVAAGAVPTKAFTNFRTLKDATKDTYEIEIPGRTCTLRYPVVSIQHPAGLLRRAHNFDLIQATVDQLIHVRRTVEAFENLGRDRPHKTA